MNTFDVNCLLILTLFILYTGYMHQRGKTTSDHWLTDALVLLLFFFILKDPIFNFRKFNSRSSHWYIILFSSSFKYLKRKLIPRLNLKNRRGERNLTHFDEVLGHIQVNLIYVHTLLCVCVWGEKEKEYFKNACNFSCIYSKCVCVLFLLSEWNEIKTRYKHIWCVFSIKNYPWVHCSKVK